MKPARQSAHLTHPDYLSSPEKAVIGFTSASVTRSGQVAWFNARQKHLTSDAPSAMAQALSGALARKGPERDGQ